MESVNADETLKARRVRVLSVRSRAGLKVVMYV